ncbi:MAG: radical SAM protein [Candidatus Omnitrophota bacterium]|jgi:wyosine [tRNA(Phe)-imidazoG37] synthetase (radical SAM superfamily)
MKYIYGPLKSRRLGLSLGISLTPYKICSFDCVYCQLGKTTVKTIERKDYFSADEVFAELRLWFQYNPEEAKQLNFITFSGSGEPLLHKQIGELINQIKKFTTIPVAVITNGSLLSLSEVRQELLAVDLMIPSLNAVTPKVFERIDRPDPSIKIEEVINGLIEFRKVFRGKIWLEVMLVKGINDDMSHIKKLKGVIEKIDPDHVQINSPVRTTAEKDIEPVDTEHLEKIKVILGDRCEIIGGYSKMTRL